MIMNVVFKFYAKVNKSEEICFCKIKSSLRDVRIGSDVDFIESVKTE